MELIITLAVAGLFGWLCYGMAETRNRNTTTWAILGVLFGIFAVIVLALLGKVEKTA